MDETLRQNPSKSSEVRIKAVVLLAMQGTLLAFFAHLISPDRMYSFADSAQYQRMALFLIGQGKLAGGYSHHFVPGLPAVVAAIYLTTGNIDLASLIANFFFSSAALLIFLKLSRSLRLSIVLIFIPYWIIASFSTLADASFIAFELAAIYLFNSKRLTLSLLVATVSSAFRLEGIFLVITFLCAIVWKKQFRKEFLIFPVLSVVPVIMWGWYAFGNPLITFGIKTIHAWSTGDIAYSISRDLSLGLVGAAKIGYVIVTLVASVLTIWKAYREFGLFNALALVALAMTVLHTLLSPVHIFPDMSRLYLYVAPITLIAFRNPLERWFPFVISLLAPLALFVAYTFWTVTFSVPFIRF